MAARREPTVSRRMLLKTGAGAVAGGALATGAGVTNRSLVGESESLLPFVAAAGAAGLAAGATGWALRDFEIIGSDDPPEGLTPEVLKQEAYTTARTRKSVNQSTFTDNRNIINYLPEAAFSEAKTAALEALEQEKTQSEVQSAAEEAANAHFTTVEKNFLQSWNESVRELENTVQVVRNHADVSDR